MLIQVYLIVKKTPLYIKNSYFHLKFSHTFKELPFNFPT